MSSPLSRLRRAVSSFLGISEDYDLRTGIKQMTCELFPPLTRNNIYTHYIPGSGCLSYYLLAYHAYSSGQFKRTHYIYYVSIESLVYNSHIGIGLYLYTRKHMRDLPIRKRLLYSIYGSMLFNAGSLLFWALTERILCKSGFIRSLIALFSSSLILWIGADYFNFVDRKC